MIVPAIAARSECEANWGQQVGLSMGRFEPFGASRKDWRDTVSAYVGMSSVRQLCQAAVGLVAMATASSLAGPFDLTAMGTWRDHSVMKVRVLGDYAYARVWRSGLNEGSAFVVIDVREPRQPTTVGSLELRPETDMQFAPPSYAPLGMSVSEGLACFAARGTIELVQVSDPRQPRLVASWPAAEIGMVVDVAVVASHLYTCGRGGMQILEVTDPAHPHVLSTLAGSFTCIQVADSWAYLGNDQGRGISIVDIRDPMRPVLFGAGPDTDRVTALSVSGGRVFAGVHWGFFLGFLEGSLAVLDVSEPTHPSLITEESTTWPSAANAIQLINGMVLSAHWPGPGITVVDVTNPKLPTRAGALLPGVNYVSDVTVSGSKAYVAAVTDGLLICSFGGPRTFSGPPQLSGENVTLSWNPSAFGMTLQTKDTLADGEWQDVRDTQQARTWTGVAKSGGAFFRLIER